MMFNYACVYLIRQWQLLCEFQNFVKREANSSFESFGVVQVSIENSFLCIFLLDTRMVCLNLQAMILLTTSTSYVKFQ